MFRIRYASCFLGFGFVLLVAGPASGQDYPNKPIRILTSTPGGANDLAARIIAQGISGSLGQPITVENRVILLAIQAVAKAPPDGYTLLVAGSSFAVEPLLRKVAYDPIRDFSPITLLLNSPHVLVVHPSLPVKSVRQLIDLAKARPGALNYATSGAGSANSLAAHLLKSMARIDIVPINYKGSGSAVIGLTSGEVQMMIDNGASLVPHVKSGKLRALAVTSAKPSALFPDLATVSSTVSGFETGGPTPMLAPAGTPAPIIARLNREVVRLLSQPHVKEKFFSLGFETVGSSPEQLDVRLKSEIAKWGKVIEEAGLKRD